MPQYLICIFCLNLIFYLLSFIIINHQKTFIKIFEKSSISSLKRICSKIPFTTLKYFMLQLVFCTKLIQQFSEFRICFKTLIIYINSLNILRKLYRTMYLYLFVYLNNLWICLCCLTCFKRWFYFFICYFIQYMIAKM